MNLASLQRIGSSRLAVVVRWFGCYGLFNFVQGTVLLFAYPFGGGVFHAMFAYSQEGRPAVGLGFCGFLFSSSLLAIVLLQFFRAGVPWWGLGLLGAFTSFLAWHQVIAWPYPVSAEFRDMAAIVAWCLPVLCFASSFVLRRVGRRTLENQQPNPQFQPTPNGAAERNR